MACEVVADSIRLTPAATAADASALQMLLWPRCAATRDDEQAVSIDTHGPERLKVYDSLHNDCRQT